ncbi:MAG: LPD38 domain-containing protein [Pseudomonadota bacterium]
MVTVIDQTNVEDGSFDEHKAMLGFASEAKALAAHAVGFSDGKGIERQGAAQTMSMDAFKEWLKTGDTKSPIATGAPDAQETQSEPNAEEGVAYFSIDGGLLQTSDLTFIEAAKAEGLTVPAEIRARAIQIAKDAGFWEAGGEVISKGALNLDGFRVQYRTTEDAAEKVTDLKVAMAKQLRKMGLPQIEAFAPEEMLATTPTGDIVRLGGFFSNDVIAVALRQDQDPMFTLSHEILHVLRSSSSWGGRLYGLFTETEWRALERQALKAPNAVKEEKIERYGAMGREIVIEELIADMAADYMTGGRSVKGFAGRALRKISQFFEALGNALRGLGFTTADQVFERISSGEVSARAESTTASPEVRFSLGPVKKRQGPQHAAHQATRMGGEPFLPDRRVWEELSDASQGYWARIQGAAGAMHDKIDAARIRIQDRFLPVLRAQEAVQMAAGKPLPPEQDVYVAETTFSGKVGRHLFEIDEDFTKPILDLIGQTKGALTVDTVGEWLTARHAIERNAAIARINPTMPDGGSGMATAKALNILQDAENGPHIETLMAIGERIDALRDRTLKLREDAGLITSEEATIWRNQYDSYVPLKGFAETDHSENYLDAAGTGRRFSISGKESRRALGRQSEAFNPLQAAITQAQEVAIRAEKNRVGQAMVELVTNNPAPKMWDVKKPKQQRVFNKTSGLVETRTDNPVGLFMNDNEMAVKVDGEEMRIIFNDRRLARAAGSVGADQMGWFIQIMSMAARYFSAVNTMMDPEFVIRNAFRDMTSAQFNIRNFGEGDRNRIAKDMAKNWPRAFAGAFRGQRNKSDTKWSQYYKEFDEAGAKVSFWVLDQPEAGKADMEKRIKLASGNLLQKASKFARFSTRDNPVLGFIERTNLAVDNAVRLAAFVSARDAGWEVQDAAALSKNLTVNFNRRGEWGATINALYPFANAGIQGTQILVRAMTAKRMIKYTVGMIALGAILDQVNASWSEEDEDGELAYDKIPDWKNQMNLVVMLGPDSGNAATIWMPYGYNIFPYMGQQASKVARGVKDPSDALGDLALAAFSAFSPLGGGNLQSILTPTMLDPVNEMVANEDWLGRPIRPESPYSDYGPDAYKFYRGASTTARVTADTLNRATGGTIAESGMIDVSPEYIDHAAGFAFGGVGRFAGRTVDLAGNLLTGQIAEIEDKDIPFYRSLQTTTGDWLDQSRYYSFRERVREGAEAAETYRENNLPVPDHIARLAKLEDGLKAVEKELRKTRKQKRAIDADEDLSLGEKATKRQEIREKDLKEMMPFNKKFVEVMGPQGE